MTPASTGGTIPGVAPDTVQVASSGRAKCRGCGRSIEKGDLRFGESLPNPYAEGQTLVWFHLACAACMRAEKFLGVIAGQPEGVAERDWLVRVAELGVEHPRLVRLARAERAASGRARCRSCREPMDKGQFRLALQIFEDGRMNPIGSIHLVCAETYFGTADVLDRVRRLTPELDDRDLNEIESVLRAQPLRAPLAKTEGATPELKRREGASG